MSRHSRSARQTLEAVRLEALSSGRRVKAAGPSIADIGRGCHLVSMVDEHEQTRDDEWQTALYEASYRYSVALKELHKANPWPDSPVLSQAINTLGSELWDRCFSVTEITSAFQEAAADLPRYAAGEEVRP